MSTPAPYDKYRIEGDELQRLIAGDDESWWRLNMDWYDRSIAFLESQLGDNDQAVAHDLYNDVLDNLRRHMAPWRPGEDRDKKTGELIHNFLHWAYFGQRLYWAILDRWKREQRRPGTVSMDAGAPGDTRDSDLIIELLATDRNNPGELKRRLGELFELADPPLTELERDILEDFYVRGLTDKEIAENRYPDVLPLMRDPPRTADPDFLERVRVKVSNLRTLAVKRIGDGLRRQLEE